MEILTYFFLQIFIIFDGLSDSRKIYIDFVSMILPNPNPNPNPNPKKEKVSYNK